MVNLSADQRAALSAIRAAHTLQRSAEHTLEARIRERLAEEISAHRRATAHAVRHAAAAGVPLRQIGRDGLGTTDYATVRRWLQMTSDTPAPVLDSAGGMRRPTDDERAAAGIAPHEIAVHLGDRIAVQVGDEPPLWATVAPDSTPAGQADAATVTRLEEYIRA